jgi:hypothetical protein
VAEAPPCGALPRKCLFIYLFSDNHMLKLWQILANLKGAWRLERDRDIYMANAIGLADLGLTHSFPFQGLRSIYGQSAIRGIFVSTSGARLSRFLESYRSFSTRTSDDRAAPTEDQEGSNPWASMAMWRSYSHQAPRLRFRGRSLGTIGQPIWGFFNTST